jgi:hypothetical protein
LRRTPVDLDDEPCLRPEGVDDVIEQRNVHLRLRKVVAAAEREESLLEVVAGRGRSNCLLGQ